MCVCVCECVCIKAIFSFVVFLGSYTSILRAILNKSWKQNPTKQQLYGLLLPISKAIQVRRTSHDRHCWKSNDELISNVLL